MDTIDFWEARAREYAADGDGLRAVCSYAMPNFYNGAIDLIQRAALAGFLDTIRVGAEVLDYGCGVGRWTREFALRGAHVTAVDFSAHMLIEAQRRTRAAGLARACTFLRSDVCELQLDRQFDVVFGVTVLQHVLDDVRLAQTIRRLAAQLRPGGRFVLVEAAPCQRRGRCETGTFRARTLDEYLQMLRAAGLELTSIRGIDPAPFKLWVVPRFRQWPRVLAVPALALATLASLPVDLWLARPLTRYSWHKLIVASAPGADHAQG